MGIPPTLDSTISDLERAVECRITLSTGTIIAGPGLVNFAAFQLKKLRDELAAIKAQAEQSAPQSRMCKTRTDMPCVQEFCDGKSDFCFRAIRDKELDEARAEGFADGIEAAYQKGLSASATWTRPIHRQHPKEEK